MHKRTTFSEFKKKALKNKAVAKEYAALQEEFDLIDRLITARKRAKLSQEEVAKQLHTRQSAVARLESGAFKHATLMTLQSYAGAVGCDLKINLVKKTADRSMHV